MMNKENIFKHFKVGYKGDYSLGIEVEVREYSVVRIIMELRERQEAEEGGLKGKARASCYWNFKINRRLKMVE